MTSEGETGTSSGPTEGDIAPDFTLVGTADGEVSEFTLSDYTADGSVLLGVYVFDFSPVCTSQMCQIRDMDWYEYKKDLTVFGVCTDGPYAHMEFAEAEDIHYPLLCDTGGEMLAEYGVIHEEKDGMKDVPKRSLFLIGPDREVRYRWEAADNWDDDGFGLNPVQEAIERL